MNCKMRTVAILIMCLFITSILSIAMGQEADQWTCTKCGAQNDTAFCTQCGTKKTEEIICPTCGTKYPSDTIAKYCGNCGTKLFVKNESDSIDSPDVKETPTPIPTIKQTEMSEPETINPVDGLINRYGIVNSRTAIRRKPGNDTDKTVVDRINKGQYLYMIQEQIIDQEQWTTIIYNGEKAYIKSKYIDPLTEEENIAYINAAGETQTPVTTKGINTYRASEDETAIQSETNNTPVPTNQPVERTSTETSIPIGEMINRYGIVNSRTAIRRKPGKTDKTVVERVSQGQYLYMLQEKIIDHIRWTSIIYDGTLAYIKSIYIDPLNREESDAYAESSGKKHPILTIEDLRVLESAISSTPMPEVTAQPTKEPIILLTPEPENTAEEETAVTPEVTLPPYKTPNGANRALSFSDTRYIIKEKNQLRLTPEIRRLTDEAPKKSSLIWSSSDEQVATVNAQGAVKGIETGFAIITCSLADDPDIQAHAILQVIRPVKSIKTEEQNMILVLGGRESAAQRKINVQIAPEDATYQTCTYISSDKKVVTVDEKGNLRAISAGKAKITIIPNEDGSKVKAVCNVTVGKAVTGITGIPSGQTIAVNKTLTLKPTILPKDALSKTVTYTSSNERIATVSKTGNVKTLSPGSTTITCTAVDGSGVSVSCTVNVIKPVSNVKTNLQRATVTEEKAIRLIATVTPSDATNKQVTWSSSNNYIAKVDSAGIVTGVHSGTCQITATAKDGSKKKSSVQVTVEPKIPVDCVTFTRKGYFGVYTQAGPGLKNITKTRTMIRIDFEIVVNYGSTNAKTYSCYYDRSKLGPGRQLRNWWYDIPGLTYSHSYAVRLVSVRYSDDGYDYFSYKPIIGIFN